MDKAGQKVIMFEGAFLKKQLDGIYKIISRELRSC